MAKTTIGDLDRCPHGRHRGDPCAGHRGLGVFSGGCLGGWSLGNPWPMTGGGDRIGTAIFGDPIRDGDLPAEGRPGWVRARFRAALDDHRPVKWPPPGPYWCSGYWCSGDGEGRSVVVAYLRPGDEVTDWWPDAEEIDAEECEEAKFSPRFPRPGWWAGM